MASLKAALPLLASLVAAQTVNLTCPDYYDYALEPHGPYSGGIYNLSYQRPVERCRTFNSSVVEKTIDRVSGNIADIDLRRLFVNTYPNTLDTAIKWRGYANNDSSTGEELTFIITGEMKVPHTKIRMLTVQGDINAMWLRDSSNQMQSYLPLLEASKSFDSLASLYRGTVNLQARYLLTDPFCNSFQPPAESGIPPAENDAASNDMVLPPYSNATVFECKYELDSLAAFLEISRNYYTATNDANFFSKFSWAEAVNAILKTAQSQMEPTYAPNGHVNNITYQFTRETDRSTETQANDGLGNPVQNGTGLIRSFFRPSDDATIFQFLIPSNMMFSSYLADCADIATAIGEDNLAEKMTSMASSVRDAIEAYGKVQNAKYDNVYAFEVDGYTSQNIMDDANIPSLLAAPFIGYLDQDDETYQNTRRLILSADNPYFMRGPMINAIGGPHVGPGYAWPMAAIVRILTSSDDEEITGQLRQLVSTTDGLGLMHESINTFNASDWTRQW